MCIYIYTYGKWPFPNLFPTFTIVCCWPAVLLSHLPPLRCFWFTQDSHLQESSSENMGFTGDLYGIHMDILYGIYMGFKGFSLVKLLFKVSRGKWVEFQLDIAQIPTEFIPSKVTGILSGPSNQAPPMTIGFRLESVSEKKATFRRPHPWKTLFNPDLYDIICIYHAYIYIYNTHNLHNSYNQAIFSVTLLGMLRHCRGTAFFKALTFSGKISPGPQELAMKERRKAGMWGKKPDDFVYLTW